MKVRGAIILVLALVLGMALEGWAQRSPGVTSDTIVIGVIAPLTGPASWAGLNVKDAGLLYFDEVNEAGGINGRKIKAIVEDDECLPSKGVAAVRKLIERDKIFALFGGVCTAAQLPALPIIKETGLPYHAVLLSYEGITKPVIKNIFRAASIGLDLQAEYMVDFAMKQFKPKRVALVNQSDEFGKIGAKYLAETLEKKYKVKPVAHEVYNLGDVDATSQVVKLKEAKVDLALLFGFPKETNIVMRQAKELGLNIQWVGAVPTADKTFTLLGGETAVGSVHLWPWGPYLDTSNHPLVVELQAKYKKKYPMHPPARPTAQDMAAYASAKIFVEGLRRAGKDPTWESFIKAMESIKNFDSGLLGKVSFSPTDHQGNKAARFVKNSPGGKREFLGETLGE